MQQFYLLLNRYELAAMAYERLGKMNRDDEKTRRMRKEAIAELAAVRQEMVKLFESKGA